MVIALLTQPRKPLPPVRLSYLSSSGCSRSGGFAVTRNSPIPLKEHGTAFHATSLSHGLHLNLGLSRIRKLYPPTVPILSLLGGLAGLPVNLFSFSMPVFFSPLMPPPKTAASIWGDGPGKAFFQSQSLEKGISDSPPPLVLFARFTQGFLKRMLAKVPFGLKS